MDLISPNYKSCTVNVYFVFDLSFIRHRNQWAEVKPESIATNELKNKTVNDLRKALLPKVKLLNPFGTLGTTMVKVKLVNRVRQQRSVSITKVANVQIHYLAPKGTPYDTSRDKRSSFLDSFIQSLQKNGRASPS